MKKLILIIGLWLMFMNSTGQEHSKINSLSLNAGPGYIVRQDLIFSPLIHKDFSFLNMGLEYQREAIYYQKLNVGFATFTPGISVPFEFTEHGESKTATPHSFYLIDIDYLIGKSITQIENPVILGLLFTTDIQLLNYVYGRIGNFGYFSSIGLGGFIRKELSISDKSSLSGTLQLPLMSWLARSPYLVNDDEFIENISSHSDFKSFMEFQKDGKLNTLNNLQIFDFEVKYLFDIHHNWAIGAEYSLGFIHAVHPQNLLSFHNSFNLNGVYIVQVIGNINKFSQKIISTGSSQNLNSIEYIGLTSKNIPQKSAITDRTNMIYFLIYSDNKITKIADSSSESKTFEVEFYDCKDGDGKNYPVVQIGNQWWMAENLAYLPNVSEWKYGSNTDPYYYVGGYNGTNVSEAKEEEKYKNYGVLYNLPAVLKVCPDEWHVPSDPEWDELARFISDQKGPFEKTDVYWYDVGTYLKASTGWATNANGTDDFGFSALPGGQRTSGGNSITGQFGNFWSSTAYFGTTTFFWYVGGSYTWIKRTTAMNDQEDCKMNSV